MRSSTRLVLFGLVGRESEVLHVAGNLCHLFALAQTFHMVGIKRQAIPPRLDHHTHRWCPCALVVSGGNGAGRRADNGDLVPMEVKVGDVVVYSKYGGTEITVGGEDLLILSARDVLAIVK